MSKFKEFYDKINSDAEIGAEFKKVLEEQKIAPGTPFEKFNEENLNALIPFAKKAGFDFTLDEVKAFLKSNTEGGELSDDELEAVAGGKGNSNECSSNGVSCSNAGVICLNGGITTDIPIG